MKPVLLEVLSSPGCHICGRFEQFWHGIEKDWRNVAYKKLDILTPEGQQMAQKHKIFASPGIVLNGELWATGGFDKAGFVEKLKTLSQ